MSLNKTKTDPELGRKVHEHLVSLGLETPMVSNNLSAKQKVAKIEKHMAEIMKTLGLDLTDDSLVDTPLRVAKMYTNEIFWGLDPENFPKCTTVENKMKYKELVVERGVSVQSNCEHHLVIVDGFATVAYIPKDKVLGLSKINRVVEYFSKRPQIQERLTSQIYHALSFILDTADVAVVIDARHYCVRSRGVEDTNSRTVTSHMGGAFRDNPTLRQEFLALVNASIGQQ